MWRFVRLFEFNNAVYEVDFSEDGDFIAVAGGFLRVFETGTGNEVFKDALSLQMDLFPRYEEVRFVRFLPRDSSKVVAGLTGGQIYLFDLVRRAAYELRCEDAEVSPPYTDAERFVVMVDVNLGGLKRTREHRYVKPPFMRAHHRGITGLGFLDEHTLASAGADGKIRLWDVASRSRRKTINVCQPIIDAFEGPLPFPASFKSQTLRGEGVLHACFSSAPLPWAACAVATGGSDKSVLIVTLTDGLVADRLNGVREFAVAQRANVLSVQMSGESILRIYHVPHLRSYSSMDIAADETLMAVSPSGETLCWTEGRAITTLRLAEKEKQGFCCVSDGRVAGLWHKDAVQVAVALDCGDGYTLEIWRE